MKIYDIFVTSQIKNKESRWVSRIICLSAGEKGYQFEKPYNGEKFFLTKEAFLGSFWVKYENC